MDNASDRKNRRKIRHQHGIIDRPLSILGDYDLFEEQNLQHGITEDNIRSMDVFFDFADTIKNLENHVENIVENYKILNALHLPHIANHFPIYSYDWYACVITILNKDIPSLLEDFRNGDEITGDSLVSTALSVGALLVEMEFKFQHESAALEGHRLQEGRKRGQTLGANVRRKKGEERRDAVRQIAIQLIAEDPAYAGNLSLLARAILETGDNRLERGRGLMVSQETVRKILTNLRDKRQLWETS